MRREVKDVSEIPKSCPGGCAKQRRQVSDGCGTVLGDICSGGGDVLFVLSGVFMRPTEDRALGTYGPPLAVQRLWIESDAAARLYERGGNAAQSMGYRGITNQPPVPVDAGSDSAGSWMLLNEPE
eukprot:s119_g20.t1